MLNVLGISGSPRREGNSETLLHAVLEGAKEAGAETEIVRLNDLTYRGCQACDACFTAGRCPQRDGLTAVIEKLREADVWIFSSPIYYDGVSGQLKTFFDRCRCFNSDPGKKERRRAGAILVTYEADRTEFYHETARRLAAYFNWFGRFEPVEVLAEPNLGPPDAASRRPGLLAKARALGKRLAEGLRR
jgi:multimeric flavodoxin WrbA